MYPRGTTQTKSSDFEILEEQMEELYRDQSRQVDLDTEWEYDDKDREEGHDKVYRIENTGAVLTMESFIPHLYHFCACLPPQEFVDLRPQFQTTKSVGIDARVSWEAEVVWPNSIHPDIRCFNTTEAWHTEKWAKRDVAFAACMKLHQLGNWTIT
ncbi:hypothetical protein BZA77DRAFT_293329 [Pyronema omphalodes]|nr:hypothetical protein BZA77DRAFT_293329 [Pyronema omphalodes]